MPCYFEASLLKSLLFSWSFGISCTSIYDTRFIIGYDTEVLNILIFVSAIFGIILKSYLLNHAVIYLDVHFLFIIVNS